MKTLQQWFDEYGVSHQNPINKKIHFICVPAIYFSIVGLLMCIPSGILTRISPFHEPLIDNWAVVVLLFVLFFYSRLSLLMAIKISIFSAICIALNFIISLWFDLWKVSLLIFVLAWIGQFYGHKIEGKKPSFLKDIQFLLIGPAWVIENLFSSKNNE
ncbi:MAG TPA: Mpo1-like protein [Flavobacterium sp.]|uniref:Mpo1 family 2-hydroxy fatty acid dioxygenase n=1 Tax=Flavobacterium sp. TaxID=239 RepID=UPI002C1606C6|nr:Mpo1-like protein [Flavobacterium sp.]HSD14810.1 Mpo1-like protein [Flavobacterium sp.]